MKTIERVKIKLNPSLEIRGVLLTMFDKRNKLSGQVEFEARNYFKEKVYTTAVPRNVRLSEASSYALPAVIYDQKCSGALAYQKLAAELLKRQEKIN